jgi:hypothetical protein
VNLFNFREALDALLVEEQERYVPHQDTCLFLIGCQIPPRLMRAPLVMSRKNADLFIQAGMHPTDIIVVDRIPQRSVEPEPGLSVMRRRGKGERKSGRLNRWHGRAAQ